MGPGIAGHEDLPIPTRALQTDSLRRRATQEYSCFWEFLLEFQRACGGVEEMRFETDGGVGQGSLSVGEVPRCRGRVVVCDESVAGGFGGMFRFSVNRA